MLFTDAYERTLDEKNRLQIPAEYRNAMEPERDGTAFYVVLGERNNTLSLYGENYFAERAEAIRSDEIPGPEALDFEQLFFSSASRVEADRQGRIVLPERQLALVDLGTDLYVTGSYQRLDIWRKSDYESFVKDAAARRAALQGFLRRPRSVPPVGK